MSDTKRIAIVAFSAPPYSSGGVASAHYNLYKGLESEGFEVGIFTFGDTISGKEEINIWRNGSPGWWLKLCRTMLLLKFSFLQPSKRAYQLFDIVSSIPGARRMNRAIQDFGPDLVILSDHGAPGLSLVNKAGMKVVLVSHHNPARFLEAPAPDNYSVLDARAAIWLEQRVLVKVDAVVCPSKYMKGFFKKSYEFEGPIRVIPNLVNLEALENISVPSIASELGLEEDATLIYLPSAGSKLKGGEYVGEIVRALRRVKKNAIGFYIPGNIEKKYAGEFENIISGGDIFQPGQISYEKHIAFVKQCRFVISLSLMENYSMALLEAALLGLPVLAFETGGNGDIIHNEKNGYLFPLGDLGQILGMAENWLDNKRFQKFRKKAEVHSQKALDPTLAMKAYKELIQSL